MMNDDDDESDGCDDSNKQFNRNDRHNVVSLISI